MRKLYRPIAFLLVMAGLAVASNFVDNNLPLPGAKVDRFPPTDPVHQWSASDANTVFGALSDIRTVLQRNPGVVYNVKAFGAVGDGSTNDAVAIQAAINSAAASVVGGAAFGGTVYIPKGVYMVGAQLSLLGGVQLRCDNAANTVIRATSSFNAASLIRNTTQNGTQEYAFIDSCQIDGNSGAGAVESEAVVSWGSLFINSYIRDTIILGGSSVGLHLFAAGNPGGTGPVLVENTWLLSNTSHNLLVEDDVTNVGAFAGVTFINLASEHQGSNASAIYLKGNGHGGQVNFWNTHIEQGGSQTNRTGITIDNMPDVNFYGVQIQAGTPANETAGITITNTAANVRIQIHGVTNINGVNPIIHDLKSGRDIGAINVEWYASSDFTFRGAPHFLAQSSGRALTVQNSSGTDVAWFDSAGGLTGASSSGAGIDLVGDATNNRPVAFMNSAKTRSFGYYYPDTSNFRLRNFTGGQDLLNFDTSGNGFVYNQITFQGVPIVQQEIVARGGAAPTITSCGTTPSVGASSTKFAGDFTTGSAATTCTVTFASSYANAPTCVISGSGVVGPTYTTSTTAITITVDVASTTYHYVCVGH